MKEMRDRDYLWCAIQMMLDDEEKLEGLCPSCRAQVERGCCTSCGGEMPRDSYGTNAGFDWQKYEERKGAVTR